MNYIKQLTQQKLSLMLAFYIGFLLNLPVFYHRLNTLLVPSSPTSWLSFLAEAVAAVLLTFFLLRLLSLGGKVFFRLTASLLVLVSVAAAYYMAAFNVVIGYGIVASVMTTDIDLSKEVIGWQFVVWMLAVNVLPLWTIWYNTLPMTLAEQLKSRGQRLKAIVTLLLALALVWFPVRYFDQWQKNMAKINNVDLPSYGGVVAHSYLPSNWLTAVGLFIYTRFDEGLSSASLLDPAKKFTYVAPDGIDDTYVVFVIGETTRWDHLGLLGYPRDTTPRLSQEKNLVAFRGESCDTSTKLSLRCMFVREGGAMDNSARTLKESNVFAVMRSLGFTSELFAMQSEVWFYNNANTNNYAFREQIGSERRNQGKTVDDILLIPELKESIARHPHGKHLVILHTKGSHYLYSQRYPREYARYQPECVGGNDDCSETELINAFDNSILYTDNVLSQVYDQLRDKKAIVFYASDHGESISENMHLHGTPREMAPPEQFRVPMIVWASESYLAVPGNKRAFEQLQAQQKMNVKHRHVELFDSVLGCLGYTSLDGGINAANNWCQAPEKPVSAATAN